MGRELQSFSEKLKLTDRAHYYREAYQSYLTTPEWLSVDISEEFAEFLGEQKSMFYFPYFSKIYQLWRVFFLALMVSIRESGFKNTVLSDYMVMDLFIVLFTTVELLPKALVSLLLYPFLPKENDTEFQRYLAKYYQDFVKEIEDTPFFNHDYVKAIQDLKDEWNKPEVEHTWVDWFSYQAVLTELRAKGFVAHYLKNSDQDEPHTTQILVKYRVEVTDAASSAEAVQNFKDNLAAIDVQLVTSHGHENVYVKPPKTKNGVTYHSVYARLEAPRYMTFKDAITQLEQKGIHLREIAGQEHVMLKCFVNDMNEAQEEVFRNMTDITPLYRHGDAIHEGRATCFFKVPARELAKTIDALDGSPDGPYESNGAAPARNTSVKFIHNF